MRKRSSRSVTIRYFPKQEVFEALERYVPEIVKRRPEIRRIVLFGSVARGDAVPGSDVDLLLVLTESDKPFPDRISDFRPRGLPVGVEVFVYTQEEIDQMLEQGNWFIRRALEGRTLYDAA